MTPIQESEWRDAIEAFILRTKRQGVEMMNKAKEQVKQFTFAELEIGLPENGNPSAEDVLDDPIMDGLEQIKKPDNSANSSNPKSKGK